MPCEYNFKPCVRDYNEPRSMIVEVNSEPKNTTKKYEFTFSLSGEYGDTQIKVNTDEFLMGKIESLEQLLVYLATIHKV